MTRSVIVALPELPLSSAWRIMKRNELRHLPITQGGRLLGIVSDRDLLRIARPEGEELVFPNGAVGEVMTPAPITCSPQTEIAEVVRAMVERKIDCIPVVSGEQLVGILTSTDLLLLLLEREETRRWPFDFTLVDGARLADERLSG